MATTDSVKFRQLNSVGNGRGRPRSVWGNEQEDARFDTASRKQRNATAQVASTSLPNVNFHRIKTPKIFDKRSDSYLSEPEPLVHSRKNSKGADALRRSDVIPKPITAEEKIRPTTDSNAWRSIPTPKTPPRTSPKFLLPLDEPTTLVNGRFVFRKDFSYS